MWLCYPDSLPPPHPALGFPQLPGPFTRANPQWLRLRVMSTRHACLRPLSQLLTLASQDLGNLALRTS